MGEVMRVKYFLCVHVCATEKKPQGYLSYVKAAGFLLSGIHNNPPLQEERKRKTLGWLSP